MKNQPRGKNNRDLNLDKKKKPQLKKLTKKTPNKPSKKNWKV